MIETNIVAFSGKKQSGKGVSYRFIAGVNAVAGIETREFFFAEPLKRMAVDILGLREEQAFGTNAEKETPVEHLPWEAFPVPAYVTDEGHTVFTPAPGLTRRTGPMTGREVLQYWGSEVYRRAYPNVWADACIRKVRAWLADGICRRVAVITDCRFPNEVDATHAAGGLVVRQTRAPYDDRHASEVALDPGSYDWSSFDFVNDNADSGMAASCRALHPFLLARGIVGKVPESYLEILLRDIDPPTETDETQKGTTVAPH